MKVTKFLKGLLAAVLAVTVAVTPASLVKADSYEVLFAPSTESIDDDNVCVLRNPIHDNLADKNNIIRLFFVEDEPEYKYVTGNEELGYLSCYLAKSNWDDSCWDTLLAQKYDFKSSFTDAVNGSDYAISRNSLDATGTGALYLYINPLGISNLDEYREFIKGYYLFVIDGTGNVKYKVPFYDLNCLIEGGVGNADITYTNQSTTIADTQSQAAVEAQTAQAASEAQQAAEAQAQITAQTNTTAVSQDTYTVEANDNLCKIAQKVYGDMKAWREIYKANPVIKDDYIIYKGQTLIIPAR